MKSPRVTVDVPNGARISNATWSPDGSRLAFFVHTRDETHIYVADPASGDSRRITDDPVLATMVTGFEWTSDGQEIATVLVPDLVGTALRNVEWVAQPRFGSRRDTKAFCKYVEHFRFPHLT